MGIYRVFWVWVVLNLIRSSAVALEVGAGEGLRNVYTVQGIGERPPGVMWVVQLSDLHISKFYPERAEALQKMMGKIIGTIQPSLVLITGDLTDAQYERGQGTQQFEEEWITYRDTVDIISEESRIPLNLFYDLRGNHDKYGVPYANSSWDYYSQYSCNARQNRSSLIQGVTLMDNSGWKNLFVGIDDTMGVGLRGPSNLFGHPNDDTIARLDVELSKWDNDTSEEVTKLVFGHFPTSFTAFSETGQRSADTMAKHNVSAFVNGHLHCKFGRQLYKHHQSKELGEFWEWEMGDWRVSRMMRILAMDHGRVSFVDVDFSQLSKSVLNGEKFFMPTIILPTSPLDSRTMLRSSIVPAQADVGAIRVLVFASSKPTSVIASVFDSASRLFGDWVVVESLKLNLVSGSSVVGKSGPFFYELLWDSRNYTNSSPNRYWMQIRVLDKGVITTSTMWPFSVEGKRGRFTLGILGFIAIGVNWSAIYPIVIWTIIFVILGGFLILPRLVLLYLERKGVYDSWALSVVNASTQSRLPNMKAPLLALLEGARNTYLWWGEIAFISFLLIFPWFWGHVLAEDYPIGYMTLWGWTVWPSTGIVAHQSGLGWPDIMGIVLPYLIAVVLPLVLVVSALCAEQAACEMAAGKVGNPERVKKKIVSTAEGTTGPDSVSKFVFSVRKLFNRDIVEQEKPLLENEEGSVKATLEEAETSDGTGDLEETSNWRWGHRVVRKMYFVCCFAIIYLHIQLCLNLASAYGAQSVFLSPFYVWAVPILLVISLCLTSSVKPRITQLD